MWVSQLAEQVQGQQEDPGRALWQHVVAWLC